MKKDVRVYLNDILEAINLIELSAGKVSEKEFNHNRDIQDATIRRVEIIGEAVKQIPIEFRKKHPSIEWKKIAGTRDVLIHAYSGVKMDMIWQIVIDDLPKLKQKVEKIIINLKES
jgi:uncharacterized protein with HEPN domain